MINIRSRFPRASQSFIDLNDKTGRPQETSKPEHPARDEQVGKNKREARDPRSRVVRIISRRRRLIDPGANLWGGSKYFEDSLRYAGMLWDDSEAFIQISVRQEKVETEEDEATIIEIDIPC